MAARQKERADPWKERRLLLHYGSVILGDRLLGEVVVYVLRSETWRVARDCGLGAAADNFHLGTFRAHPQRRIRLGRLPTSEAAPPINGTVLFVIAFNTGALPVAAAVWTDWSIRCAALSTVLPAT